MTGSQILRLASLFGLLLGASAAEAKHCRPFHLNATAQLSNVVVDANGNLVSGTVSGSGTASHMGNVTALAQDQFGPPQDGRIHADGSGAITAANGDQLGLALEDAYLELATGVSQGRYVFSRGTGRFSDASGSADFHASPDPANPGSFILTATGTLCY